MKAVRTFSKSEEAHLAAALLGSRGIEAVVVEDSSFGGNLLGTTFPGGIRVDVAEEFLEAARQILLEAERNEGEVEATADLPPTNPRSLAFDLLVALEIALMTVLFLFPDFFDLVIPQSVIEIQVLDQVISDFLWTVAHELSFPYFVLCCLSSLLLLIRLKLGRILFFATMVFGLFLPLMAPAVPTNQIGGFLVNLMNVLGGMILVASSFGPVAREFKSRPG